MKLLSSIIFHEKYLINRLPQRSWVGLVRWHSVCGMHQISVRQRATYTTPTCAWIL